MNKKTTPPRITILLALFCLQGFYIYARAPRPSELAGTYDPAFAAEEGEAVCCPLPRDVNITGDLYVGGNVTINGIIFGAAGVCNNTLLVKTGTLHGPNEFNSVKAAVDSITTNSATNPFVVKICPGVYTEDTITLKPYVAITTDVQGEAIIQPSNPANTIIVMAPFSIVQGVQLEGATTPGTAAITFNGGSTGGCLVQNCFFGSNDILINQTATSSPASVMFVESCIIWSSAQFTTGFQVVTTGAVPAIFKGNNITWLQSNNTLLNSLFNISGSAATLILDSSDFGNTTIVPSGIGIQVENGAKINIKSVTLAGFATAMNVPNIGAGPYLKVLASTSNNCTNDLVISNSAAHAVIEGIFSDEKMTVVPGASVAMFILDPTDIETVTVGEQKVGNIISQVTNITPAIQQGATLGTIIGGTLSDAGGLNIQVLAGTGYLMVGTAPNDYLQYTTWNTQTLTLPANTVSFIWVDNTGTAQFGASEPNPITTIPLGKAETESSIISFLQEQPQEASHLATNLDITLQNGLGPIYNYGSLVSLNGTDQLNVSPGNYFFGSLNYMPAGGIPVSWDAFYQNGSGGQNIINAQDFVPFTQYDDGSGTLAPIPPNEYTVHAFYVVNDGVNEHYLLVYGQTLYTTLAAAQAGGIPPKPSFWSGNIALIASIIVQNNPPTTVVEIDDQRPRLGFKASGVTAQNPLYQTNFGNASPVSGLLQILGNQNITTTGSSNTINIGLSGTTQHAVQIGNAGGSLTSLTVGITGQVLTGTTGADPAFAALGTNSGLTGVLIGNGNSAITASAITQFDVLAGGASNAISSISPSTAGYVLVSNGIAALPTFQPISASGGITTINGNSGSLTPTAGVVTIAGGNNINTTGSGSTLTVNVSGTTQHSLLLGNATGSINSLGVATNGQIPIGNTGSDPVLALPTNGSNISWAGGAGTLTANLSGTTQHAVQIGNAGGSLTSLTVGTTGQVLTGTTGADPAFAALGTNSGLTGVLIGHGNSAITASAITQFDVLAGGASNAISSISPSTAGYVLVSNGIAALPTFQPISASGGITTINGNSGSLTPTAGVVTIRGGNNINTTGSGSTLTVNVSGTTQNSLLLGNATGSINSLGVATNGQIPIGNTGSDPVLALPTNGSNISWAGGAGTLTANLSGTTQHAVQIGNAGGSLTSLTVGTTGQVLTSATGADPAFAALGTNSGLTGVLIGNGNSAITASAITQFDVLAGGASNAISSISPSTAGYVLVSNGIAALPTFQPISASGAITTINGDSGSISGSTVTIAAGIATQNSGSSVSFVGSGSTLTLNVTDTQDNTILGSSSGNGSITGTNNVSLGAVNFTALTTGTSNTAVGTEAMRYATSATGNVAIGLQTLENILTGSQNIALGYQAGLNYNSSESNNITIGSTGTTGESGVIRIGIPSTTSCFISGINGVNVGAVASVVTNSGNQLGTATLTSTGGTVVITPGANTINLETSSAAANSFTADSGAATPAAGVIDIAGGSNINTSASGNTVTVNLNNSPSVSGSLTAGTTITAGTGITATTGDVSIQSGNLNLGAPTATTGLIFSGGVTPFIWTNSGVNAVFVGVGAGNLAGNATTSNVGIGVNALFSVVSGPGNVAVGASALRNNVSGQLNAAIGYTSLSAITSGSYNVAVGYNAGANHTSSDSGNINIGAGQVGVAGESNITRIGNVSGSATTACYIAGINGVSLGATANIVGTSGDQLGTTATTFTATGTVSATAALTSGTTITAGTGITATTGNVNVTAGNINLPNSTATTGNIVKNSLIFIHNFPSVSSSYLGVGAGNLTNTGTSNTGIGNSALTNISSGQANTAVGTSSLRSNTTGVDNTSVGYTALFHNVSGGSNTAIGFQAGVAIGTNSPFNPGNNVFVGANAGGAYNAAENGNICIGSGQTGTVGESGTTRIGTVTGTATSACFIAGINGVTVTSPSTVLINSSGQLGTISSSLRYKENIVDLVDSTEKFMQLRPVQFNYKKQSPTEMQIGLIAEEVEELYPDLVIYNENGEPETVKYHLLYALLIKMIQENRKLSEENRSLIQELFALCGAHGRLTSCCA